MMPQEDPGFVPAELRRALVDAAVLGLAQMARRDGGAQPAPGMRNLLARLDGTAVSGGQLATMEPSLVGVAEAAEMAGVSRRRMRELLASRRLRGRHMGRYWLVEADSAKDYRRERRHGADDDSRGEGDARR